MVSSFRFALSEMDYLRNWFISGEDRPQWAIPLGIGILVIFAVLVSLFLKWEPLISGSGIPQVEGEFEGKIKPVWWRVLLLKFLGGLMAIGSGLALGREGPSIQLGAMTGKGFSRLRGRLTSEERMLVAAGAGAGLAAAFGAPLAGLVFVLEEIYRVFDSKVLLSTLAATIVADFISSFIFGLRPVITIFSFSGPRLADYWMIILLGVLLAQAFLDEVDHELVGHQLAGVHVALGLHAEGAPGLDRRTKQVAGGDVGKAELLHELLGLCALARARCAKKNEIHVGPPFSKKKGAAAHPRPLQLPNRPT